MVTFETTSGNIIVNPLDNKGYSIILDSFIGEINIPRNTHYVQFILKGISSINSSIILNNHSNLDNILFKGNGGLNCRELSATSITIHSNLTCARITCNAIKISNGNVNGSPINPNDIFIQANGHIWLTDSIFKCNGYNVGVETPYMLIDNCKIDIKGANNGVVSDNPQVIDHCINQKITPTIFKCDPLVKDDYGNPLHFTQVVIDGNIISRRDTYTYEPAYTPLNTRDKFREQIGYTNTNLHRRVDQEGEFESPSISSPKYEVGIRGVYSFRGTDRNYHEEKSLYDETP